MSTDATTFGALFGNHPSQAGGTARRGARPQVVRLYDPLLEDLVDCALRGIRIVHLDLATQRADCDAIALRLTHPGLAVPARVLAPSPAGTDGP